MQNKKAGKNKYAAFLRGINVGGHKRIKMDALIKTFTDAGFKEVRTYIQSGNVIFQAPKTKPDIFSQKIERLLLKSFGYEIDVMIRSEAELESIIKKAPFTEKDISSDKKLYVTYLYETISKEASTQLMSLSNKQETFHITQKEIYTIRDPKLNINKTILGSIDKKLKISTTTRNWNVTNKIFELCK